MVQNRLIILQMDSNSLKSLDLGENDLNNEGIHCLKVALINNRTLLHLGLKGCHITCQGESTYDFSVF